jgi:hypothetical protein
VPDEHAVIDNREVLIGNADDDRGRGKCRKARGEKNEEQGEAVDPGGLRIHGNYELAAVVP